MRSIIGSNKVSIGPDPMYRTGHKFAMPGTDGRYSITTQVQTNDPYKSPHNGSNLRSVDTHVKDYDLSSTNRQPFPSIVEQSRNKKHQASSELKKDSLFDDQTQTVGYSNDQSIQINSTSLVPTPHNPNFASPIETQEDKVEDQRDGPTPEDLNARDHSQDTAGEAAGDKSAGITSKQASEMLEKEDLDSNITPVEIKPSAMTSSKAS